jgi:intermembrane space import and assembly protein 40
MENGDINWNCPCLGGMATGPCGNEFREAFSCFHFSQEEDKGSDCFEQFKGMQECMQRYPSLYDHDSGPDMDAIAEEEKKASSRQDAEEKEDSKAAAVTETKKS